MTQEVGRRKKEVADRSVPLRGTQTFVGVMVEVWKRPTLMGLEMAWRWLVGIPLLALGWWAAQRVAPQVAMLFTTLQGITLFQPFQAAETIAGMWQSMLPVIRPLEWALPLVLLAWVVVSVVGRTLVLKRLDKELKARPATLFVLLAVRALVLCSAWGLWVFAIVRAGEIAVTGPVKAGDEPHLVVFFAIVIVASLLLFAAWASVSWILTLAPLVAMVGGWGVVESLRRAVFAKPELRSKLVETNLVMGIVKVALIVLAMVFSACPLPFSNVETQQFLTVWWCGVGVWWLAMSDFYHVVRSAAYLRLWRALEDSRAQGAESAS